MMFTQIFVILSCLLFLLLQGCASPQRSICGVKVEFTAKSKIEFNDNEKLLLCGDANKESWKDIPPAQSEYTLRNFLRQRGYFHPHFTFKDGVLNVDPGEPQTISSVRFHGEPPEFNDEHLRDIVGTPLTSAQLDKVQNFALNRLKNLSYACPDVKLVADQQTGAVDVTIDPGRKYNFSEPNAPDSNDLGLNPNAIRRFDAFAPGKPFRQEWVKLTSNRAETDGIVISSEINSKCPSPTENLELNQRLMGADKRIITAGGGASTEEFPIAQVTFKSVRLDDRGSNLLVNLYGSQRRQMLKTIYTDFIFHNAPRFDWAPKITIEHNVERTFNASNFEFSTPLEYRGDTNTYQWIIGVGPTISRTFMLGDTPGPVYTLSSIFGRFTLTSHDYELYLNDPRTGWMVDLNAELVTENVGFSPFANVYQITGSYLFKINPVDPPQWLMGFRAGLATIDTAERAFPPGRLPARRFFSLGGDQDLRGFGRRELNLGTIGALTSVFAGTELRYAKTLSLGLEPFVFFDIGSLGGDPWSLAPVYFYDPGLGIRWSSPIGAVRATFAHGFVSRDRDLYSELEHFQLFLSFGREF